METQTEKRPKSAQKKPQYASIRVRKELRKQIQSDLERINKKDFGRRVRTEDYLSLAVSLVTADHLETLKERTLSNADRLERDYRAHIAKHGHISKDEYLGKRLSGEISAENPS
jgi:hypothetical protein